MRRFRLRVKLRTLMIATAAGAVLLGVAIEATRLKSRSSAYGARVAVYASKETLFAKVIKHQSKMLDEMERIDRENAAEARRHSGLDRVLLITEDAVWSTQVINMKKDMARYQAALGWYAMMKTRYQFAGSRPWLTVPPDPPEPPTRRPR